MMKISLPGVAASLLTATFLAASIPCHVQGDEPKTPLSEQMSGIQKDFRSLRKMLSDPSQKDAAVALVKDMEARATKSKGFDPSKTKQIPAADKDQFLADYHKQMDGLIADFQKLEQDITDGKTADATAMLDTIQSDKRQGHKKFNGDGGGPGGPWQHGPGGPGGPGGNPPPSGGPPPGAPSQSGT